MEGFLHKSVDVCITNELYSCARHVALSDDFECFDGKYWPDTVLYHIGFSIWLRSLSEATWYKYTAFTAHEIESKIISSSQR